MIGLSQDLLILAWMTIEEVKAHQWLTAKQKKMQEEKNKTLTKRKDPM